MKKLIYGSLFFALILIITVGCDKDLVSVRYQLSDFEYVGIEHNKMLGETFSFIKDNINTIDSVDEIANFLTTKISNNSSYSEESNNIGVDMVTEVFSDIDKYIESINSREYLKSFSEEQAVFLLELDEILSDSLSTEKQIMDNIKELENEISEKSSLSNQDLTVLFSATVTARHSFSYWSNNYSEWDDLGGGAARANFGDIAKADGVGAATGAIRAAIVNLWPGGGQVAYGSAIVGGGLAASTGAAIDAFCEWIGW